MFPQSVMNTLAELAEEHLKTMSGVLWSAYADGIAERASEGRPAGDTFGCTVDGRYYDVGDSQSWIGEEGGDIRLVSYATTYVSPDSDVGETVSREVVIRRPA